jgi:hypothetical protein
VPARPDLPKYGNLLTPPTYNNIVRPLSCGWTCNLVQSEWDTVHPGWLFGGTLRARRMASFALWGVAVPCIFVVYTFCPLAALANSALPPGCVQKVGQLLAAEGSHSGVQEHSESGHKRVHSSSPQGFRVSSPFSGWFRISEHVNSRRRNGKAI